MKQTAEKYLIVKEETDIYRATLLSSKDVYEFAKFLYDDKSIDVYESMYLIMLSVKNVTKGYAKISQGGTFKTVVDVKLILKYAIDSLADRVILVHNHPSGEVYPSTQDLHITQVVNEMLDKIEIKLLDHLIVSKDKYYSFADEGKL